MRALSPAPNTAASAVMAYLRAKDENRPQLMRLAFDEAATLEMIVRTGTISFPPLAQGREAITDVLVRRFGQNYENVRTFCLARPPESSHVTFSCPWLVGMSEKESRSVRVGCGTYDWVFQAGIPLLAQRLTITIEVMAVLAPGSLTVVMGWMAQLPYPWRPGRTVLETIPTVAGLEGVQHWIAHGAL